MFNFSLLRTGPPLRFASLRIFLRCSRTFFSICNAKHIFCVAHSSVWNALQNATRELFKTESQHTRGRCEDPALQLVGKGANAKCEFKWLLLTLYFCESFWRFDRSATKYHTECNAVESF